jgi:cytochrome c553
MNIRNVIATSAAGMLLAGAAFADGDAAAGKQKTAMCQGCHGIVGYRTAFPVVYKVPKLGGQRPGYIINALQGYKSGDRHHPTMRAIAAGLTDQDMADLAAYYAAEDIRTAGK